jgi:hypothetical protein
MRNYLIMCSFGFFASCPALEFATYPYNGQPRQQTVVREEAGTIRTIYDDVASPMLLTMPGTRLNSHGQIDLAYRNEVLYREDLADESKRDEGEQNLVDCRLRLQVWKRVSAELRTGLVFASVNDDPEVIDLDVLSAINLYQDRYRGGAIAFGVGFPIGSGKALGDAHEGSIGHLAYVVQLRCTESYGFNVWHLNVGGRYINQAETDNARQRVTSDGEIIPEGEWHYRQMRLEASIGYSYRPMRWFRLGLEGKALIDLFDGDDEPESELTDRHTQAVGFAEFNPSRNVAIRGEYGFAPDLINKDGVRPTVVNCGLLVRF